MTTDRAAVVSDGFQWRPIDARTPRGCKLQLINRAAGVACYGTLGTVPHFWTHWAPLPTFADDPVHQHGEPETLGFLGWLLVVCCCLFFAWIIVRGALHLS